VDLGITALGGAAKSTVWLNLDASSSLKMTMETSGSASAATNGPKGASGKVAGCVNIDGALNVNAGTDASLFKIFEAGTKVSVFEKKYNFLKVCSVLYIIFFRLNIHGIVPEMLRKRRSSHSRL
jgi:hypothetical protein